jgi:hypothetical protein
MKAALSSNPSIVVLASEEDDAAIPCSSSSNGGGGYAVVFDPLDGSRNIDAAIPTGACRDRVLLCASRFCLVVTPCENNAWCVCQEG